ncbi:MAG: NACHT domain-containing protein, partial [Gammaproteobacteria bacterium]
MRTRVKNQFQNLLEDLNYVQIGALQEGENWGYFTASFQGPISVSSDLFLLIDDRCTWAEIDTARATRPTTRESGSLTVVVRSKDSSIYKDSERTKNVLRLRNKVLHLTELLHNAIRSALGQPPKREVDPYFVDPYIDYPAFNEPVSASQTLTSWLRGDSQSDYPVAVLLAPAATGKTTLSRHLFSTLVIQAKRRPFFPLIITRDQWVSLVHQEYIDLQDLWEAAVGDVYTSAIIGAGQIERCITYGAICPIFDGMDELCSFFPSSFNPNVTVQALLELFSEKERGGRLLLTSRTGFWQENISADTCSQVLQIALRPFSSEQRDQYINNRFPHDPARRERADKILDRLATRARPRILSTTFSYEKLENLPYVVMLAAESADTDASDVVQKYGNLLGSDDPLEGLILALCERERIRQRMTVPPEQQLQVLEAAAAEYGKEFNRDDLDLIIKVRLDMENISASEFDNHGLLQFEHNNYAFRFPFVREYLNARSIRDWMIGEGDSVYAREILQRCRRFSGSLLERCIDLILARVDESWRNNAKDMLGSTLTDAMRSGLFCLCLALCKKRARTRAETTQQLLELFSCGQHNKQFRRLYVSGEINGLDLSDVVFDGCRFTDLEFVNCVFNEGTRFFDCSFQGALSVDHCENFAAVVDVDKRCTFSTAARSVFQSTRTARIKVKITREQINDAIKDVLGKFSRGANGFTTRKQQGIRKTVRLRINFSEELMDSLERANVLETFINKSERMYR